MINLNKNVLTVILLIIGLGAGFFGGMQYQKSQAGNGRNGAFTRRLGNGQNAQAIRGSIDSIDNNSLTVKLMDGSGKIVLLNEQTTLEKNATASASDLKSGENITAFGTQNSDGSVTAMNIQIGGGFRGPGQGQ